MIPCVTDSNPYLEKVEDDVRAPAEDEYEYDDKSHLDCLHFGLGLEALEDHYYSVIYKVTN